MTPPAGPEEVREPDFERVAEIVRNQLSGAGAGCKCNGCMIARAYVALHARVEDIERLLAHWKAKASSSVRQMQDASDRLAKLEQERGRGEG